MKSYHCLIILLQYTIMYTHIVEILVYHISIVKILYNVILLCMSSPLWLQSLHIGSLKYTTMEILPPQKLVNATNQSQIHCFVCLYAEAERNSSLISKIDTREKQFHNRSHIILNYKILLRKKSAVKFHLTQFN